MTLITRLAAATRVWVEKLGPWARAGKKPPPPLSDLQTEQKWQRRACDVVLFPRGRWVSCLWLLLSPFYLPALAFSLEEGFIAVDLVGYGLCLFPVFKLRLKYLHQYRPSSSIDWGMSCVTTSRRLAPWIKSNFDFTQFELR